MSIMTKVANSKDKTAEAILIENVLEAFGIFVKVIEIKTLHMYYEYYLDVSIGTNFNKLEKLDREIAMALASPTGTVDWLIPVPGRSLIGLRVPRSPGKYFEEIGKKKKMLWEGNTLKAKIAFVFYLLGEFCYYITYKMLK